MEKRPEAGLLAGMWGLPMLDGWKGAADVETFVRENGYTVLDIGKTDAAKHIFTHIEWNMHGYAVEVEGKGVFSWASPSRLKSQYAVPSAFRAFMKEYLDKLKQ